MNLFSILVLCVLAISSCSIIELELLKKEVKGGANVVISDDFEIPFQYPLVKQCGEPWADDLMGNKTICMVGCLMSSTSMGIAGVKIQIDGLSSDPGTLNTWLKANDGYSNNNLIEGAVPKIDPSRISWPADAMHTTNDLPYDTVCKYIHQGRIVIGNVLNGGHFVLLVGYSTTDGDTFLVNDSGFNTNSYSYSKDIVGYRIFDMKR
jgi:hypothetical protein